MTNSTQPLAALMAERRKQIGALVATLRTAACPDGGLPAEGFHDLPGTWPTAQTLANLVWMGALPADDPFCHGLRDWLLAHQNPDGSWPFRAKGEGFLDTTAWALWGLSYYAPEASAAVQRGVRWLLDARHNENGASAGGWGVHPRELDRVYSTFIALVAVDQLLRRPGALATDTAVEARVATVEALHWMEGSRNTDGGWGIHAGQPTDLANTTHALLALLIIGGVDPCRERAAFEHLRRGQLETRTWPTVTEIFELHNGLDLRLSWFTTPYCLWALSLGLSAGLVTPDDLLDAAMGATRHLTGGRVSLTLDGQDTRTWAISDYLFGEHALLQALHKDRERLTEALTRRGHAGTQARRADVVALARERYPFTIASLTNAWSKSSASPAQRLSLLLLAFEGIVRYLAAVATAVYISSRTENPAIDQRLRDGIMRPSLGTWWGLLVAIARLNPQLVPPTSVLDDVTREVLDRRVGRQTLARSCEELIALRNRTKGHGALDMLSARDCEELLAVSEETLFELLEALTFLANYDSFFIIDSSFDDFEGIEEYRIKSCKGIDALFSERVLRSAQRLSRGTTDRRVRYFYFQDRHAESAINLFPFLLFQECPGCNRETVLSYGSSDGRSVEYLSYQCGHVCRLDASELFRKRLGRWINVSP